MFKKIKRYARDPYYALGYDMIKKCPHLMSDKFYLSVLWKIVMGYELDWKHPKTFNEKLQWLKLYDRNPLYTTLVDKVEVKKWVADKIGEQYVIPTLAVYKSVDEIDMDKLPDRFVLKCNHDSGSVVVCKDKSSFDLEAAKRKLDKGLKHDFYSDAREWPYKNVERCVFAEQFVEDGRLHDLPDYKFFAFDGEVKALFIATERDNKTTETRFDFFDMDFNHIEVTNGHPNADVLPDKPKQFDKMVKFSEILSKGIPQVRCDFYEADGELYFGEMTFYHWGGMTKFNPSSFDLKMGNWITLPKR